MHRLLEGTREAPRTWAMPEEAPQAKSSPRPPTSAQAAELLSRHRSLLKDNLEEAAKLVNADGQVIHTFGIGTTQASSPGWGCRCSKFDRTKWNHCDRHKKCRNENNGLGNSRNSKDHYGFLMQATELKQKMSRCFGNLVASIFRQL